jgi:transcriptional regulator GlxA family with amidase domain
MKIAIVLFEHCTALDAVGPYEVLSRWPNAEVHMVGERKGPVRTDTEMLALHVDATYDEVPEPDIIMVPGGYGQRDHREGSPLHSWLHKADAHSTWTTSACTGSLILASAGLLSGRRATTHWLAYEDLAAYGAIPSQDRVVFDDKYVTAAGVSAGIDMALTLAAKGLGDEMAQIMQLGLEYDPQPPFAAGGPRTAPQFAIDAVIAVRDYIV